MSSVKNDMFRTKMITFPFTCKNKYQSQLKVDVKKMKQTKKK